MESVSIAPPSPGLLTFTVWRLNDPRGYASKCLISERDGHWQLVVWHKTKIVFIARYGSDDEALDHADKLWRTLHGNGWSAEPAHLDRLYRRACPDCRRQCVVVSRRSPSVAVFCTTCKREWADQERVGSADRRKSQRATDRRQIA